MRTCIDFTLVDGQILYIDTTPTLIIISNKKIKGIKLKRKTRKKIYIEGHFQYSYVTINTV